MMVMNHQVGAEVVVMVVVLVVVMRIYWRLVRVCFNKMERIRDWQIQFSRSSYSDSRSINNYAYI